MLAFFKNEFKSGFKGLLIWALAVGGMGLGCILLYKTMEGSMSEMAESMASLGMFSEAFGMNTLSVATLKGFFATEVGTTHSLGSSLFAASIATIMLSKEEESHTAEYTYILPISRGKIVGMKNLTTLIELILFTLICTMMYYAGFCIMGESESLADLLKYMLMQLIMNIEIATLCLIISATSKKNKMGMGMAVAMLLYAYDLMARVIPKLENVKFLSPFSYSNATSIFASEGIEEKSIVLAGVVIVASIISSWIYYVKKDLAS